MPATAQISTEIDPEIMEAATQALKETGFTLAEVIRLMISKTARDKRLPFDAEAALEEEYGDENPNALTRETFEKIDRGEEIYCAKDLDDLFKQLRS